MSKKALDLSLGLNNEENLLDTFRLYFNEPLLKKTNQYSMSDYSSSDTHIELKTRRCQYNTYPTTIIGYNKCKYYSKLNKLNIRCFFIFHFLQDNTIYYIQYDDELFKMFQKQDNSIIRDYKIEYKENIHIPITYLTKISQSI